MNKKITKKPTKKTTKRKTTKRKATKSTGRPLGRPCLLDKKMHDRLVSLVAGGNYYTVACAACNISYEVFNHWMRIGINLAKDYDNGKEIPKDRLKYLHFLHDIKKAEAFVETQVVGKILVDKDWKAQMTYLERKYPDRWGRVDRQKHEGEIKINVAKLTDEELVDILNDKYKSK